MTRLISDTPVFPAVPLPLDELARQHQTQQANDSQQEADVEADDDLLMI